VTVVVTTAVVAPPIGTNGSGSTFGMAVPFNITSLTGFTDSTPNANVVNILGSPDRLVEYSTEAGG
jgi:hypothetical protein